MRTSITFLKNNLYLHFYFLPVAFIKTSIRQANFTQILLGDYVCEFQRPPAIQSPYILNKVLMKHEVRES